jgi:hypothetical protein
MVNARERNIYQIDQMDHLVYVSETWDQFAISNDAPEMVSSMVIGRSLWDFVTDDTTRHIYKAMLTVVRSGEPIQFNFRCDSPETRRFLDMQMTPFSNGGVQFETSTIRTEERSTQEVFRKSSTYNDNLLITCSWCNRINTGGNTWHEAERAVQILHIFEFDPAPRLSHGMCSRCYEETLTKLNKSNRIATS